MTTGTRLHPRLVLSGALFLIFTACETAPIALMERTLPDYCEGFITMHEDNNPPITEQDIEAAKKICISKRKCLYAVMDRGGYWCRVRWVPNGKGDKQ